MKIFHAIAAVAFCAAITSSAAAQQRTGTTPAGTSGAPTSANVPDSKIALVNTDEFSDEKLGINRLVNAMKLVDSEFQPKRTELQTLTAQYQKAQDDLSKAAPMQDPAVTAKKSADIEDMKKSLTRKGEDAQAAYTKRMQEKLSPIYEDIGKALDAYAKAHGITLVLDISKMGQAILAASDALDITKAFITEFNSKNPATASLAP
jgi:outer membrane protein